MQRYQGTIARRRVIEQQATRWQHSLDSLTTALGAQKLPVARQELLISRYREALQQRIRTAGEQADQLLIQEVNSYLKQYGARYHYQFILGATEGGNIVYAAPGSDLTEEVIKELNQQYNKQH